MINFCFGIAKELSSEDEEYTVTSILWMHKPQIKLLRCRETKIKERNLGEAVAIATETG